MIWDSPGNLLLQRAWHWGWRVSLEGQWSDWNGLILCHKQITVSALLFCCSCEMEVDKQRCRLQCLRQAWSHRCAPKPRLVPPAAMTAVFAVNVTRRLRFSPDCPQAEDTTIPESPLVLVFVTSGCSIPWLKASGLLITQTTRQEQYFFALIGPAG